MSFGIYLDMDGVLCDLEAAVLHLAGIDPEEVTERPYGLGNVFPNANADFWRIIKEAGAREVFANLAWLPYGKAVVETCLSFGPVKIATACGHSLQLKIEAGKREWLARELPDMPVVFERKKHTLPNSGYVLVDDREMNVVAHRKAGRVAILFPRLHDPNPAEWIQEWTGTVLPVELNTALEVANAADIANEAP